MADEQGEARTIGSLITRIQVAQRNLGPHNPYRLLLVECAAAFGSLATQLIEEKRARAKAELPYVTITRVPDDEQVPA